MIDAPWVVPLKGAPSSADLGGKGQQLAALLDGELPAPGGFCVTGQAFDSVLVAGGLGPALGRLKDHLAERTPGAEGDAFALGEQLRRGVLALALPEALEVDLRRAWVNLGARSVAVRSSSSDEDGALASFAGQHETHLGVRGWEALLTALRRTWASLFSPGALRYRLEGRSKGGRLTMAVLVQPMLHPRASGVLFTRNPMTGSGREMALDAAFGLGEAVVSGETAADSFLLSRPASPTSTEPIVILHRVIAAKERRLEQGEGGGLIWAPVPPEDRDRPALSDGEALAIARLGLRVEDTFGSHRDIEWAIDASGHLYLLQARPITTGIAPDTHRRRRDILWTRRFSGERWTDGATPLGWSIIAPLLNHFVYFDGVSRRFLEGSWPTRLYRGQPYFNITIFRHLIFKLPKAPPPQFILEFFPREEQREILEAPHIWPDLGLVATILKEVIDERRWERFEYNPLKNHRAWEAFLPGFTRAIARLPDAPETIEDCLAATEDAKALAQAYLRIHVTSLAFSSIFYQLLDTLIRRWAELADPARLSALVTHTRGNLTIATNRALFELALKAQASPAIQEAIVAGAELEDLDRHPGGPAFTAAFRRFLDLYGHRATSSWEIFSPRWGDHPELPLDLVRSWLRAGMAQDPDRMERESEEGRRRALAEISERIRANAPAGRRRPRLAVFRFILGLARSYALLRENQRFYYDQLLVKAKRILDHLGALLAQGGRLAHARDIRMLTFEEVLALTQGALEPGDARALVALRLAQARADADVSLPTFLKGEAHYMDGSEAGVRALTGLGISPGRVTGIVRVLHSVAEGGRLGQGDILVTRATDPGWTPLFLTAGGLVMELGSLLSHGAVVAREYRVPAVVNISDATQVLKDGQRVTLDGDRGVVYLH